MTYAILRGFDFPATDGGDQVRFCNPLVSFEEGESAPIYFVRDLHWSLGDGAQSRWFTRLDSDEIETFATLVPKTMLQISPGDGIVLIGEQISAAARSLEMEKEHRWPVEFTEYSGPRFRIGIANADSYREFVRRLTDEAALIFDGELSATKGTKLSERGKTALFVLRKFGFSLPTVLAIRQLAAARVSRQWDRDRRLLIRFSRELQIAEDVLDQRVNRHLRHLWRIRGEPTPISPRAPESSGTPPSLPKSARFQPVREHHLKSLKRVEPNIVTATHKSEIKSRPRTLLRTETPDPLRASALRLSHIGTTEQSFKFKKFLKAQTPSAVFTSPTAPYGAPFHGAKEKYEIRLRTILSRSADTMADRHPEYAGERETTVSPAGKVAAHPPGSGPYGPEAESRASNAVRYEIPISPDSLFMENLRYTFGGKSKKNRLQDMEASNLVALAGSRALTSIRIEAGHSS